MLHHSKVKTIITATLGIDEFYCISQYCSDAKEMCNTLQINYKGTTKVEKY